MHLADARRDFTCSGTWEQQGRKHKLCLESHQNGHRELSLIYVVESKEQVGTTCRSLDVGIIRQTLHDWSDAASPNVRSRVLSYSDNLRRVAIYSTSAFRSIEHICVDWAYIPDLYTKAQSPPYRES